MGFFDNDNIPIFGKLSLIKPIFSGKRISRGQYKTKDGYILNADVNGALNILKKSNQGVGLLTDLLYRGAVNTPKRISI